MSESRQGYKRHGSRYKARRRAVDILFEAESRDVDPVAIIDDRRKLSRAIEPAVAPVAEYTEAIINGVAVELDAIDVFLSEHIAETWVLERLPSVDRAVLRVACWEMIYNPDVPVTTAVVEAVEIASQYSTDNASAYINATLDGMAAKIDILRERATGPQAVIAGQESLIDDEDDSNDDIPVAPWDDSIDAVDPDGSGEEVGEEVSEQEPTPDPIVEQPASEAIPASEEAVAEDTTEAESK
ncbi:transcription antitermination factor NusB [uncultured Corynebacterium sp.]|uniref:transcription antitermination factor NusB n=1 Tax=uncultured Corynebacterium sp. TaxID=159447 RepID=UPI0025EF4E94|nr:transcription antitermination factor NusB [uncultured Corynebacterium sp.]